MHYNGANSYLFVTGTEIINFKAKDSEIAVSPLCLRNILKDLSKDNIEKTRFYRYRYDFRVDYDDIAVNDALDMQKYLMGKHDIK